METEEDKRHTDFNVRTNHLLDKINDCLVNESAEYPPKYTKRSKDVSSGTIDKWQKYLDDTAQLYRPDEVYGYIKHKLFLCQALIHFLRGDRIRALASFNEAYSYERGSSFEYYEEIFRSVGGKLPKKSSYHKHPHDTYELEMVMADSYGKVPLYKHLTVGLRYMLSTHFSAWSEEEISKYATLRGIEWLAFPAFISMGVGGFLLLVVNPLEAVLIVVALNVLWSFFARYYINLQLAKVGVYLNQLKFVVSPGLFVYFLVNHNVWYAIIALLWPIISMLLSLIRVNYNQGLLAQKFQQRIYEHIR